MLLLLGLFFFPSSIFPYDFPRKIPLISVGPIQIDRQGRDRGTWNTIWPFHSAFRGHWGVWEASEVHPLSLFSFIRSRSWSGRFLGLICCSQSAATGKRSAVAKRFCRATSGWAVTWRLVRTTGVICSLLILSPPLFFWMTPTNSIHSETASTVGTI